MKKLIPYCLFSLTLGFTAQQAAADDYVYQEQVVQCHTENGYSVNLFGPLSLYSHLLGANGKKIHLPASGQASAKGDANRLFPNSGFDIQENKTGYVVQSDVFPPEHSTSDAARHQLWVQIDNSTGSGSGWLTLRGIHASAEKLAVHCNSVIPNYPNR